MAKTTKQDYLTKALAGNLTAVRAIREFAAQPNLPDAAQWQAINQQLSAARPDYSQVPISELPKEQIQHRGLFGSILHTLGGIAPLAALIPGVGVPLAAGIGAVGGLASGGGIGGALKGAALGGGGAALLGGQGYKGIGSIGSRLGIGGAAAGTGKTGGILGWIARNPERAAALGLGIAGTIQASQAQHRATDLQNQALAQPSLGPVGAYQDAGNPYAGTAPVTSVYDPYGRRRGQATLLSELSR